MKAPKQLFLSCVLLLATTVLPARDVPRTLTYCGVEIQLTDDARAKVQEYVDNILEGPRYFNEMVKRAHTYMPFIEEAFDEAGIPDDLKYLAIQESALRPDVVSSSQAVGFWQFKEATGREFGLIIDDKIDERMHIFRSSEAAAKYFQKANRDFDNWVYAVMAYFHGFTGAIQYTDPQYYGARKMVIGDDLHWYPLKAIAHKLAYEDAVSLRQRPLVALIPYSTDGEYIVKRILESHQGVDEEEFFLYNKWIRDQRRLPREGLYTYYIPKPAEFYTGHIPDPVKIQLQSGGTIATNPREAVGSMDGFGTRPPVIDLGGGNDRPAERPNTGGTDRPAVPVGTMAGAFRAVDPGNLGHDQYVVFNTIYDVDYGQDFILYNGWIGMPELAERIGVRLGQLLMWNDLTPTQKPEEGRVLYLTKPKSSYYHIVQEGESILSISEMHRRSVKSIIRKNRLDEDMPVIYIGQKLYMKKKRPKDEKIIILRYEKKAQPNEPKPNASTNQQPDSRPAPQPADNNTPGNGNETPRVVPPAGGQTGNGNQQPSSSEWIMHTVRPGETLWQIAQKYGTQVEIIKRINNLGNDNIQIGQELKVLSRTRN